MLYVLINVTGIYEIFYPFSKALAAPRMTRREIRLSIWPTYREVVLAITEAARGTFIRRHIGRGVHSVYIEREDGIQLLYLQYTIESNISASHLDLFLSIWKDDDLHISLYDNRDDFNFHITNFPFLSSNIP